MSNDIDYNLQRVKDILNNTLVNYVRKPPIDITDHLGETKKRNTQWQFANALKNAALRLRKAERSRGCLSRLKSDPPEFKHIQDFYMFVHERGENESMIDDIMTKLIQFARNKPNIYPLLKSVTDTT